MENLESVWQVGLLALLAGAMIGALAYRLFAPSLSKADKVRSELETARQELIDYKASVNSHFDKTSELVNDLTQNYVKVYRHLAEGAQALGGSRELNRLLDQKQGKVLLAVDDDSPGERNEVAAGSVDSSVETVEAVASHETTDSTDSTETAIGESGHAPEDRFAATGASTPAADPGAGERAGDGAPEADAANGAADSKPSKTGEPLIDVSRIEQGAAETGKSETELGTLIPEPGKEAEIKPTRH